MDSQEACQGQVGGMEEGRDLAVGILDTLTVAKDERGPTVGGNCISLGSSWWSRKGLEERWIDR